MTKVIISFALGMAVNATASAGITIHFNGSLNSESAGGQMEKAACGQARKNSWRCESISGQSIATQDGVTARGLSELDGSNALSKARGVVIYMHVMSEPLYLVYGNSLRISNFVKTQFAGADV
ncbi:MAG TPA: hypothetical protein H9903_16135, partial [Candidatus Aquabacterium excrementipullorum]|nr:hypothetical protein [Candidatus Aquabacterium excrementipullorum]